MPYGTAVRYWKAINIIQARDYLLDMNVVDYPRMTKEGRRKFHREMRKQAYPVHLQKEMDYEDFAKKVGLVK